MVSKDSRRQVLSSRGARGSTGYEAQSWSLRESFMLACTATCSWRLYLSKSRKDSSYPGENFTWIDEKTDAATISGCFTANERLFSHFSKFCVTVRNPSSFSVIKLQPTPQSY